MKTKQQKQIKLFLIKEFGNDKGNTFFAKQAKRLNEIIECTKNKTENQMKTLVQTILPRIALCQIFLESGMSKEDIDITMRKYMLDFVATKSSIILRKKWRRFQDFMGYIVEFSLR